MVLTQLEATVAPEQWNTLKQAYHQGTQKLPPVICQTYLTQDEAEKNRWRILTIWQSRQALEAYRATVKTPEGVLMFRTAGAEPTLTPFQVIDSASSD